MHPLTRMRRRRLLAPARLRLGASAFAETGTRWVTFRVLPIERGQSCTGADTLATRSKAAGSSGGIVWDVWDRHRVGSGCGEKPGDCPIPSVRDENSPLGRFTSVVPHLLAGSRWPENRHRRPLSGRTAVFKFYGLRDNLPVNARSSVRAGGEDVMKRSHLDPWREPRTGVDRGRPLVCAGSDMWVRAAAVWGWDVTT